MWSGNWAGAVGVKFLVCQSWAVTWASLHTTCELQFSPLQNSNTINAQGDVVIKYCSVNESLS